MSFIILKYLREMIDDTRGHLIQFLGLTQRRRKHLNFSEDFIVSDNEKNDSIDIELADLPSVDGYQGPQGNVGVLGAVGFLGVDGLSGSDGVQGPQGFRGMIGLRGSQGVTGASGLPGVVGDMGCQGFQGVQGVQGARGFQGSVESNIRHSSLLDIQPPSQYAQYQYDYHIYHTTYDFLHNLSQKRLIGNPKYIPALVKDIELGTRLNFLIDSNDTFLYVDCDMCIQKDLDNNIQAQKMNFLDDNIFISDNLSNLSTDIEIKSFIEGRGVTGSPGMLYKDEGAMKSWEEGIEGGIWKTVIHEQNKDYKLEDYSQVIESRDTLISGDYVSCDFLNGSNNIKSERNLITLYNIDLRSPSGNLIHYSILRPITITDFPDYEVEFKSYGFKRTRLMPSSIFITPLGTVTNIRDNDFVKIKKFQDIIRIIQSNSTELYREPIATKGYSNYIEKGFIDFDKICDIGDQKFIFYKELNGNVFVGSYNTTTNTSSIYMSGELRLQNIAGNITNMLFYKDRYYVLSSFTPRVYAYNSNFQLIKSYKPTGNILIDIYKYKNKWFAIIILNNEVQIHRYRSDSNEYFYNIREKTISLKDNNDEDIYVQNNDAIHPLINYKNGKLILYKRDDQNPGLNTGGMATMYVYDLDKIYQAPSGSIISESTTELDAFSTLRECKPFMMDGHYFIPEVRVIDNKQRLVNLHIYEYDEYEQEYIDEDVGYINTSKFKRVGIKKMCEMFTESDYKNSISTSTTYIDIDIKASSGGYGNKLIVHTNNRGLTYNLSILSFELE